MYTLTRQGSEAGFLFVPPAILSKRPSSVGSYPGATLAGTQAEFTMEDVFFMRALATPKEGQRFGQWLVLSSEIVKDKGWRCLHCLCLTCRIEHIVRIAHLWAGRSRQCVMCGHRTAVQRNRVIHGFARSHERAPEYKAWVGMKDRCLKITGKEYKDYGGRGIKVYEEWLGGGGFQSFLDHVGMRPSSEHSIDRYPNNDGNYEPGNVRWATPKEQNRNRRNNRLVTYQGRTQCAAAWAEELGLERLPPSRVRDSSALVTQTRRDSLKMILLWIEEIASKNLSSAEDVLFTLEQRVIAELNIKTGKKRHNEELIALADAHMKIESGTISVQ